MRKTIARLYMALGFVYGAVFLGLAFLNLLIGNMLNLVIDIALALLCPALGYAVALLIERRKAKHATRRSYFT